MLFLKIDMDPEGLHLSSTFAVEDAGLHETIKLQIPIAEIARTPAHS